MELISNAERAELVSTVSVNWVMSIRKALGNQQYQLQDQVYQVKPEQLIYMKETPSVNVLILRSILNFLSQFQKGDSSFSTFFSELDRSPPIFSLATKQTSV